MSVQGADFKQTIMAGRIIGIIISIGLIIGGLSGGLVLRGTNSSTALVVAGFIFLAYDIFMIIRDKKKEDEGDDTFENNEEN